MMATSVSQGPICSIFQDGILELKTEARGKPVYNSILVNEDTLLIVDDMAWNLQLYSLRDGKLLSATHRLESIPMGICFISKTEVALCLIDSKIIILSFESVDEVKLVKTLDLWIRFYECHSVVNVNSEDKLVVSGLKYDDGMQLMFYWCVVSLTDGRVHATHKICKGGIRSHLAIKDNTVYISCSASDSTVDGVRAYYISNPDKHKFIYQNCELTPWSIIVDRRNYVFVCDKDSNRIHQLTDSGQLVAIHTVSSTPNKIYYDDQHTRLYTTRFKSNVIYVYKLEYSHLPGMVHYYCVRQILADDNDEVLQYIELKELGNNYRFTDEGSGTWKRWEIRVRCTCWMNKY